MLDINELVSQAQSEETFSFADVVNGRGYPRDEVTIFMDEASAHEIKKLERSVDGVLESLDAKDRAAAVVEIEAKIKTLREKINKSRYVFKVVGLSSETKDDLYIKAREDIKPEYDHNKNFITGQVEKVEKPSPKRDRYYTNLLWQASIEQIVSPTGAVDTAPAFETVALFRSKGPESQLFKFQDALQALSVASEAFESATDDDFLAKS